jgi:hypothetical protein
MTHLWRRYRIARWRRGSESNRRPRLCRPLHDHSATPPGVVPGNELASTPLPRANEKGERFGLSRKSGAGKESRTPDLNLGKVALYQLSYSRDGLELYHRARDVQRRDGRECRPVRRPPCRAPTRSRRPRIRCSSSSVPRRRCARCRWRRSRIRRATGAPASC